MRRREMADVIIRVIVGSEVSEVESATVEGVY